MSEETNLPTVPDPMAPQPGMSPALQIMLNPTLFERAQSMARFMSQAEGFLPKHLIGKPAACFAVLTRSITWKLDPYAVAQSTFQIPGSDKVGYEGKLVAAILENSGKLIGGVKHEHFGEWSKVMGKFHIGQSRGGKDVAIPDWTREDAKGLGIIIRAMVKGEPGQPAEERSSEFLLEQAYPLNSPLWATDPKTQIFYAAVRRFANTVATGLLMGVPWEGDTDYGPVIEHVPSREPQRGDFAKPAEAKPADAKAPEKAAEDEVQEAPKAWTITLNDGAEVEIEDPKRFAEMLIKEADRVKADKSLLDGLWESNSPQFGTLPPEVAQGIRDGWPKHEPKQGGTLV